MSEQMRVVVAERPRMPWGQEGPELVRWHIPAGPADDGAWWIPIKCGEGITLPGGLDRVPRSQVCKECLRA